MSDFENVGLKLPSLQAARLDESNLRVVEAPPPNGAGVPPARPPVQGDSHRPLAAAPSARVLANLPGPVRQHPTGMQRAVGALRVALPFVQRILPLLDGNIGTAVSNILAPQPKAPPPLPPVNLAPIQEGLADLRIQHRALRDQVAEQNASLKKMDDQLQQVRDATDRNTLEQEELLGDLKSVGNKVNLFAFIALALLGVSVLLNVVLYLQIRHIIP